MDWDEKEENIACSTAHYVLYFGLRYIAAALEVEERALD